MVYVRTARLQNSYITPVFYKLESLILLTNDRLKSPNLLGFCNKLLKKKKSVLLFIYELNNLITFFLIKTTTYINLLI